MHPSNAQAAKQRLPVPTTVSLGERQFSRRRVLAQFLRWKEIGRFAPSARLLVYGLVVAGATLGLAAIARVDWGSRPRVGSVSRLLSEPEERFEVPAYNRRAAASLRERFGTEELGDAGGLIDLAAAYQQQQRYSEAANLYDRALVILMHHLGAEDPRVTATLTRLAELHLEQGNSVMASAVLEFLYSVREREN